MQSRKNITKLLDLSGPSSLEEIEWADREYPTATDAEKYRLVQAQRLLNQTEQYRVPKRRRVKSR